MINFQFIDDTYGQNIIGGAIATLRRENSLRNKNYPGTEKGKFMIKLNIKSIQN